MASWRTSSGEVAADDKVDDCLLERRLPVAGWLGAAARRGRPLTDAFWLQVAGDGADHRVADEHAAAAPACRKQHQ